MMDASLIWLAGWLEGEGSFYSGTPKGDNQRIHIQVFSIDRDVIEKAAKIMEGSIYFIKARGRSQSGWRVEAQGECAANLMRRLLPFMGKRRSDQILKSLSNWDNRKNQPKKKFCACGCGEIVFGGPRIKYAKRKTGACAMRAFRAKKSFEATKC